MVIIEDKTKCSGCGACHSICPTGAIRMVADEEGFLYPVADRNACIDCNLCEKICPVINPREVVLHSVQSFVLRCNDAKVLKESTSGGFITPLTEWVFKRGGVVCAAAYDTNFEIQHILIDAGGAELARIRGSKYVQSRLENCFKEIKMYLERQRLVCFVGTGCQVAGLLAFLGDVHQNLVLVELVCHGVSSPKLWNKYLGYQKEKYRSEIEEISFRNKTYGYHGSTMKIKFISGKTYYGSARVDYMLKSFFSEISSRPICYDCPFKTIERNSDFVIYDCWHAGKLVEELKDDDRGYTNILVQTKKGENILNEIKEHCEVHPVKTVDAIRCKTAN